MVTASRIIIIICNFTSRNMFGLCTDSCRTAQNGDLQIDILAFPLRTGLSIHTLNQQINHTHHASRIAHILSALPVVSLIYFYINTIHTGGTRVHIQTETFVFRFSGCFCWAIDKNVIAIINYELKIENCVHFHFACRLYDCVLCECVAPFDRFIYFLWKFIQMIMAGALCGCD